MTTITSTAALRASFALPPSILPMNIHANAPAYDAARTALNLLDAALATLLPATDDADDLADDFHADPFHYLDIDANADDDAPITLDDLRAMITDHLN